MTKLINSRGSEWLRWDLHVHSPASHEYSGTWDDFFLQLELADCDVVGINDYCSVSGYKRAAKAIRDGDIDIGSTVILPVVEFRMTTVLKNKHANKSGTNINFHIIFDPALDVLIIEDFLKSLEVENKQISKRYEDSEFLKSRAAVDFPAVVTALRRNNDFDGRFLVWLPYDEYGGIDDIDPNVDEYLKMGLVNEADIIGSGNRKQIDFFLWRSESFSKGQFRSWFGFRKPSIKGSDSHSASYPLGKLRDSDSEATERYCWIKALPSFSGLRQIVYEPETRVFIGEGRPVQPTKYIESIELSIPASTRIETDAGSDAFCFAGSEEVLGLSPYFNCIVGGRGTGKSTLLNLIGLQATDSSSADEFWSRSMQLVDCDPSEAVTINGVTDFEFIGQNRIEQYASDPGSRFTEAIYDRLKQMDSSQKIADLEDDLTSSRSVYTEVIKTIEKLEDEESKREALVKEKKNYESILATLNHPKFQEKQSLLRTKAEELEEALSGKEDYETLGSELEEILESYDYYLDADECKTAFEVSINELLRSIREGLDDKAKSSQTKKAIAGITELTKDIDGLENEIAKILEGIGLAEESIEEAKGSAKELERIGKSIDKCDGKINRLHAKLEKYDPTKPLTVRDAYEASLVEGVSPLQAILSEAALDSDQIKEIALEYRFDTAAAWSQIAKDFYEYFSEEHHDGRRSVVRYVEDFMTTNAGVFSVESKQELLDSVQEFLAEEDTQHTKFIENVFASKYGCDIFLAIRDEHLSDSVRFRKIDVRYDGKLLANCSFGQRCTAVIVLILLFGNTPLIIDEPEAHLDGDLIANYLVPVIKRRAKVKRQIIFATHNANFVVNADAEKIFVLRDNDGITEILGTAIEDQLHREDLLKLEGGIDAFNLRHRKYAPR